MSQTSTTATYESLGCWKDDLPRAITADLEGIINPSNLYDEHYKRRSNAVQKCFKAALSQGKTVFAIQDGGQCFSSNSAQVTYKKYGSSNECVQGKGGPMANDVYEIKVQNQQFT